MFSNGFAKLPLTRIFLFLGIGGDGASLPEVLEEHKVARTMHPLLRMSSIVVGSKWSSSIEIVEGSTLNGVHTAQMTKILTDFLNLSTLVHDHRRTVKPVLIDHPTVEGKMVVIHRWSLEQGFPQTDRFFDALLNSGERCGAHVFDLRNDNSRQSGASGGLMRWFSRKLRCGGCFDSK